MGHGVLVPREVRREFWGWVGQGLSARAAAGRVGVSRHAGQQWFREAGGVIPRQFRSCSSPPEGPALEPLAEPSGVPAAPRRRQLTLVEREEIVLMRADGVRVREIGRRLGKCPSRVCR